MRNRSWTTACAVVAIAMLVVAASPAIAEDPSPAPTMTSSPGPTMSSSPGPTSPPQPGQTVLPLPGVPNGPPSIAGICSTQDDHLWRISTTELDLMYDGVAYSPSFADMNAWRRIATLERVDDQYQVIVSSSRADGPALDVIWQYFSGMRNSAIASEAACAPDASTPAPQPSAAVEPDPSPIEAPSLDDIVAVVSRVLEMMAATFDAITAR